MLQRAILLPLFLIWTVVGVLTVLLGIDGPWLIGLLENFQISEQSILGSLLIGIEATGDALWLTLAAALLLSVQVERLGVSRAFIDASLIVLLTLALECLGAKTGWPFGAYEYTERLGVRIFTLVPWSIPFAWYVVVTGAYHCALYLRSLLPSSRSFIPERRGPVLLLCGVLALLTDINLEPVATSIRHYWSWLDSGSVPWQNYLSWFICCSLIAGFHARRGSEGFDYRGGRHYSLFSISIFALVNAFFLLIRLGDAWRNFP